MKKTDLVADFCAFQGFPETRPFAEVASRTGACSVDVVIDAEEDEAAESDIVVGGKET